MDSRRLLGKVSNLFERHGVARRNAVGAYSVQPLRDTEYLMHEVAHWMTLGRELTKLPRRLSTHTAEAFRRIPTASQNSLELDTTLITYLAGYALGLWDDPGPIIDSCRRNLKGMISLGSSEKVANLLKTRWDVDPLGYDTAARQLAKWLYPSAKLLPTSNGFEKWPKPKEPV